MTIEHLAATPLEHTPENITVKGWDGQTRDYMCVGTVKTLWGIAYQLEGARGAQYGLFPCIDSEVHFNVINLGRGMGSGRIFGARQFRLESGAFVAHA